MRSFRPALLLPLFVFLCATLHSQSQTTQPTLNVLTNQDVVDMLKAGLTEEIVIAKIKASACDFDTSPATLKQLKATDVPDRVILTMVQAPAGQHVKQNESHDSVEEQNLSITGPEPSVAATAEEDKRSLTEVQAGDKVYTKCPYGRIAIHSDTGSSPTVAIVVCGDVLTVLEETNGGLCNAFLKVRTQGGVEGYVLANFVSKTKTQTGQIDSTACSLPAEKPAEHSCKQPPWPSGQIWDIGSLTYSGVASNAAGELLANSSKYYLVTDLPEEGDPPIVWWTKVTCPEDADIWIFAKKHPQYVSPLQPNTEVYQILITSPQPGGWMIYNHMFIPEGSLWTPLEQTVGKLRDLAAKQTQKSNEVKQNENLAANVQVHVICFGTDQDEGILASSNWKSERVATVHCNDVLTSLGKITKSGYLKVKTQQGVIGYIHTLVISSVKP